MPIHRLQHRGFFGTLRNSTYVCNKHKYARRGPGQCPICREECQNIGDRHRIGHEGQFDKIERKTRNLKGQKVEPSWRQILARRERLRRLTEEKLKSR